MTFDFCGHIVENDLYFNPNNFSDHILPPEHYERGRLNPRDGSTEQQQQVMLTGKQIIWNINKYRSFQDNGLFL